MQTNEKHIVYVVAGSVSDCNHLFVARRKLLNSYCTWARNGKKAFVTVLVWPWQQPDWICLSTFKHFSLYMHSITVPVSHRTKQMLVCLCQVKYPVVEINVTVCSVEMTVGCSSSIRHLLTLETHLPGYRSLWVRVFVLCWRSTNSRFFDRTVWSAVWLW